MSFFLKENFPSKGRKPKKGAIIFNKIQGTQKQNPDEAVEQAWKTFENASLQEYQRKIASQFFLDPTPLLNAKLIRFGPLCHENPIFSLLFFYFFLKKNLVSGLISGWVLEFSDASMQSNSDCPGASCQDF